jgi:glycosyltransferase involved in cell wall biosynthesis
MKKPLLSIVTVAYNHGKYIARTLDGFIMQKTDFPFQVIVGDDASTDNTADIIREYADKYPDIVKPVLRPKNIGGTSNSLDLYSRAHTKYVAICDGDDYWTDPLKLQKQVDFLEAHPDYSICSHRVIQKFEYGAQPDIFIPKASMLRKYEDCAFKKLLRGNYIHSSSIVYRWQFADSKGKDVFPRDIIPGDWFLLLLHAHVGKIHMIPDVMSVYLVHSGGIWGIFGEDEISHKYAEGYLSFCREVEKKFGVSMKRRKIKIMSGVMRCCAQDNDFGLVEKLKSKYGMEISRLIKEVERYSRPHMYLYRLRYYLSFGKSRTRYKKRSLKLQRLLDIISENKF